MILKLLDTYLKKSLIAVLVIFVVLLEFWVALFIAPTVQVKAATTSIEVTTTVDENTDNASCSLREAVIAANQGGDYNGCSYAGGLTPDSGDTIEIHLVSGSTYDLSISGASEDLAATGDLDFVTSTGSITVSVMATGTERATIDQNFGGTEDRTFDLRGGFRYEFEKLRFTRTDTGQFSGSGGFISSDVNGLPDTFVTNCLFTGGNVTSDGGAISINDSAQSLTVVSSTFTSNNADLDGGAIFLGGNSGSSTIKTSFLTSNTSGEDGGAIKGNIHAVKVLNTTVSNNTSGISGGGISVETNPLTITNSSIKNNTASSTSVVALGGGIHFSASNQNLTLDNAYIANNISGGNGGGLYHFSFSGNDLDYITSSTVYNNFSGQSGGGMYLGGDLEITQTIVDMNSSTLSAGGVYAYSPNTDDPITITSSTISNNESQADGGGIYVYQGDNSPTTTLQNVTISSNSATDDGGAVFVRQASSVSFEHVSIINNSATDDGGAIFLDLNATSSISNSLLVGNTSNGGSVENCDGNTTFLFYSLGYNVEQVNSDTTCSLSTQDVTTTVATASIVNATLADNGGITKTHALISTSPAIDAASSSLVIDQRGTLRSEGAAPDAGAYEFDFTAGVTVSETSLTMTEGSSDDFTVVLDSPPTNTVFINLSDTSSDVSISSTSLEFNSSTWNTAQTVTVSAVDDSSVESSETLTVVLTASTTAGDYNGISVDDVEVTINDNDTSSGGGGAGAFFFQNQQTQEQENINNEDNKDEEELQTCELTVGKAYKHPDPSRKDVWLITKYPEGGEVCYKRVFTNTKSFFTYFSSFSEIRLSSKIDDMFVDPLGFMPWGPLWERQYGAVVKDPFDSSVYLILGNKKHKFVNELVFSELGYKWSWVEDVDSRVLSLYTTDEPILESSVYPDGAILLDDVSNKFYQIATNDGKKIKREILGKTFYKNYIFREDRLVLVSILSDLLEGDPIF